MPPFGREKACDGRETHLHTTILASDLQEITLTTEVTVGKNRTLWYLFLGVMHTTTRAGVCFFFVSRHSSYSHQTTSDYFPEYFSTYSLMVLRTRHGVLDERDNKDSFFTIMITTIATKIGGFFIIGRELHTYTHSSKQSSYRSDRVSHRSHRKRPFGIAGETCSSVFIRTQKFIINMEIRRETR